ncbi:hypothetical protein [Pseudodesulfovibrio sp.]|uniref:hypothetical protein n=1 Tax=unclassified Pseudodesulfovibrio TaxID=2661612 RepID=UPI003B00801C
MKHFLLCVVTVAVSLGLFSGCAGAGSNVGGNDYYRASKDPEACGNATCWKLVKKFNDTSMPAILPGQPFSINMSTAFIGKFQEYGDGEIAIVARISERAKGSAGLDWNSNAADSGRLIYYSGDVKRQQPNNFSYIPVYGPIKYGGRPVDIQLYIFEIDNAKQFKPLLQQLTKAGQQLYPPASPVLGVLNTLGSTLLTAARNDKMFEFSLCLWPQAPIGDSDLAGFEAGKYPVLEAGHYVFARAEERTKGLEEFETEVMLSKGDNRLVSKADGKRYIKDSYIVLHVKRDSYALTLDEENSFYKTFKSFKDVEETTAKAYADKITNELAELGTTFVHDRIVRETYNMLNGVGSAIKGQEGYVRVNATTLLYDLKDQITARTECDKSPSKTCSGVLTKKEIETFLAILRSVSAFKNLEGLTYKGLNSTDVPDIVGKAVENLPQNATRLDEK